LFDASCCPAVWPVCEAVMVGQRLLSYIQSCGLEPDDVPKVAATFLAAKYSTWACFIAGSVRFRPMRRLLARPPQPPPTTWLHQQRQWLHQQRVGLNKAWERTKERAKKAKVAASTRRDQRKLKPADRPLLRMRYRLRSAVVARAERTMERARATSWYESLSRRYWNLSDKLESAASRSRFWAFVASVLGLGARDLALGFAEGTILFKCTVPLHAPLELWFIMSIFKQRRAMMAPRVTAAALPELAFPAVVEN